MRQGSSGPPSSSAREGGWAPGSATNARGPAGEHWLARLRSLQEIAHAVNSDLRLESVLQTIVDTVATYSPWRQCCIARLDPEGQEVRFVAERGFFNPELGNVYCWPARGSITPVAVQLGRPMAFEDILAQDEFPGVREDALVRGYRSLLVVPLRGIEPAAAVWFCGDQPHRFTTGEIAYAAAIADQAAIAIKNAELHERERRTILELERLNQVIARQNQALERQADNHMRLTQMVLSDQGLDVILQTATQVLGNPVVLFDRWLQALGTAGCASHEAPSLPPHSSEQAARLRRPLRVDAAGSGEPPAILAPIMAGRELFGLLLVVARWRALDEEDLTVAEQVAMVLALELMKGRIAYEVELRVQTDFLSTLLAGGPLDGKDLGVRAALLGLDPARPTYVLLFALDDEQPEGDEFATLNRRRELLDTVRHALRRREPSAVVVLQGRHVAALLPANERADRDVAALVANAREESARLIDASVSASFSRPCQAPADYALAYRQARKTLEVQRVLGRLGQTCSFEQLGVYGLLFSDDTAADLARFTDELLGGLVSYDRRHHAPLRATLEAFLRHNGNLRRTASELFVHISTLRYRLRRIEEITGLSLDDAEHRFRLQLALRIASLTQTEG